MKTIVWFRGKDLRLADHEPLHRAAQDGDVVALFVLDPRYFGPGADPPPHRLQFLIDSLHDLDAQLRERGGRLVVVPGPSAVSVPRIARELAADRVLAHRSVEPAGRRRDERLRQHVNLVLFEGETLLPPGIIRTRTGTPYKVFTPFARAVADALIVSRPLPAPGRLSTTDVVSNEVPIPPLPFPPNPAVVKGGERAARRRLDDFLRGPLTEYGRGRDLLGESGTSRLSQDLKFGTLSVRTVWHAVHGQTPDAARFLDQLLWREFAHHLLWDRPELLERPFMDKWSDFPWLDDEPGWRAWASGNTGYPVVDAAARQLLTTGFVHNRARMIAASFLCKHLQLSYRRGEAHYLGWLTDGDPAQNNLGWQWSAGCGCDAQPWFRVFNPVTQGRKFDKRGDYVRQFVPELRRVPDRYIHAPWQAPPAVLSTAGVELGRTYPRPIVDHALARQSFLDMARSALRP